MGSRAGWWIVLELMVDRPEKAEIVGVDSWKLIA